MLIRQLLTDEALERTAGAILPKLRHLPAGFDPEDEAWDIAHAAREALIGEA